MNVMQLNTDIYNSLGVLSNDESYLEKAARYLKKIAQAKRDVENAKAKEEALASINQAFTELKLHRGCGKKWSWKINTGEAFVWIF